jgi:hypothetical protein
MQTCILATVFLAYGFDSDVVALSIRLNWDLCRDMIIAAQDTYACPTLGIDVVHLVRFRCQRLGSSAYPNNQWEARRDMLAFQNQHLAHFVD